MDVFVRALVVCALISYGIFRLLRYFRYGMARRVTSIPPSTWGVLPKPGTVAESTVKTPRRLLRIRAGAISVLLFVAVNAVLLIALFGLPALVNVPVIWRLFLAIFVNFYLLPFARAVGQKALKQMQARTVESENPFGG